MAVDVVREINTNLFPPSGRRAPGNAIAIIGMAQGRPLGLSGGAERLAAQGVFAADGRYRRGNVGCGRHIGRVRVMREVLPYFSTDLS